MNTIQQASNCDKIAEHWNQTKQDRQSVSGLKETELNKTGMFVQDLKRHKT